MRLYLAYPSGIRACCLFLLWFSFIGLTQESKAAEDASSFTAITASETHFENFPHRNILEAGEGLPADPLTGGLVFKSSLSTSKKTLPLFPLVSEGAGPDNLRKGSKGEQSNSIVRGSLQEIQKKLDRRIARFEVLAKTAKSRIYRGKNSQSVPTHESGSPYLTFTSLGPVKYYDEVEDDDSSVPVLEEVVVEATPLDPFDDEDSIDVVQDPWEEFNSLVFMFNVALDQFLVKPIATGYDWIMPNFLEEGIRNAIHNIRFVPRFANSMFQAKFDEAGSELGRFLINSTLGIAGIFDVAKFAFDLNPSDEDMGQTLALYGVKSGPYVILPFLPPRTVRDLIGSLADIALDPLSYFLPFGPQIGLRGGEFINKRSRNLELFEGVHPGTIDLYGEVRATYFQKRSQAIWK